MAPLAPRVPAPLDAMQNQVYSANCTTLHLKSRNVANCNIMHLRLIIRKLIKYVPQYTCSKLYKQSYHILKVHPLIWWFSTRQTELFASHLWNRRSYGQWILECRCRLKLHTGTIPISCQQIWVFLDPTHLISINIVLNVCKIGHFLDPPTQSFCWRNIGMIPQPNATAQTRDYASFQIVTNQRNDLTLATNLSNPSINAQWDI